MPTTVFVEADGTIVEVHTGKLTADRARARSTRTGRLMIGPLAYAFGVGMVATFNPCGFAMLPAYLSYFLGLEDASTRRSTPGSAVVRALTVGAS